MALQDETLIATPYFEVVRRADGIVLVTRTELPFATIVELDRAHGDLERVLEQLPRAKLGIVVDLRLAPSRNDPAFERAMGPHRHRMFEKFARRAVIVRSAAGRLQVRRHAHDDGFKDLEVFTDVVPALEHARP